jgi:hypothetical protein
VGAVARQLWLSAFLVVPVLALAALLVDRPITSATSINEDSASVRGPNGAPASTATPGKDTDLDGCTDAAELQPEAMAMLGGGRDPNSFWDFYDVPSGATVSRDQLVNAFDLFEVVGRFNSVGDSGVSPFAPPPPPPAYHVAYDRGPSAGPNAWNLTAADGLIAATDMFGIIGQFGHSCALVSCHDESQVVSAWRESL